MEWRFGDLLVYAYECKNEDFAYGVKWSRCLCIVFTSMKACRIDNIKTLLKLTFRTDPLMVCPQLPCPRLTVQHRSYLCVTGLPLHYRRDAGGERGPDFVSSVFGPRGTVSIRQVQIV
jgi:hypothetical protein